jgi:hypothetical protein
MPGDHDEEDEDEEVAEDDVVELSLETAGVFGVQNAPNVASVLCISY